MSAVVIGASGGIGGALADALEEEGETVVRLSRPEIDLLEEASIAAAAARVGSPALVVVATGLLHEGERGPEKAIRELDAQWLTRQFAVNAIGPALVAKHFLPVMPKTGKSLFAVLSARVGSISDNKLGGWYGYRASKAALNQLVRTLAMRTSAATTAASSSRSTRARSTRGYPSLSSRAGATCSSRTARRCSCSTCWTD